MKNEKCLTISVEEDLKSMFEIRVQSINISVVVESDADIAFISVNLGEFLKAKLKKSRTLLILPWAVSVYAHMETEINLSVGK